MTPGGPPVTVRLARPSDLRRLAAIEDAGQRLFAEHLGDDVLARTPALRAPARPGAHRAGEGHLLVAAAGRTVIGFAHLVVPDSDGAGWGHLDQLSVLPEHGRRGVGGRLLHAASEVARWAGLIAVSLCTYRDVAWNAPWYARHGFVVPPRLERYQRELREAEQHLGLDAAGERVVMVRELRRPRPGDVVRHS